MKYLSLFSGIGGFEYGIQKSKYQNKFQCIGFSEIDKYAKSIYKRHYPNHTDYGDVTKIKTEELPEFNFLVGGFPCQSFSIAGKRKGFDDTRGTMFFEIARILKAKKPKYFLLENVKGLLSHDAGKTFQTMLRVLSDLGYDVQWKVYNSKNYGVPQNRERIYIKGYSRKQCKGEILRVGGNEEQTSKKINYYKKGRQGKRVLNTEGINTTLTATGGNSGNSTFIKEQKIIECKGNIYPSKHSNGKIYNLNGISPTLTCGNTCELKIKTNEDCLKFRVDTKKGYEEGYPGDSVRLDFPNSTSNRARCLSEKSHTLLTNNHEGVVTDDFRIRRLTPVECERLQGFPDNWTKYGVDGELISDTQRYKCIGNAVTSNVVTSIMNQWVLA